MHYYKFDISLWAIHTSHLSPIEESIYFRLINYYYDTEAPIPTDLLKVIKRLRLTKYKSQVEAVLEEFFKLENGFWIHLKCDKVLSEYHTKGNRNKEIGKLGGRPKVKDVVKSPIKSTEPKTELVLIDNPNETLINNDKLIINNYKLIQNDKSHFDVFWKVYPKKVGKDAALKSWNKLKPNLAEVLQALEWQIESEQWTKQNGQFIPNPATYLNQGRWQDEPNKEVLF